MKFITLITLTLLLTACASEKSQHSSINSVNVNDTLVKGKSTQAQIIESFGTPDIAEKTPDGDMWAYNRHSNESQSVGGGVSHYAWTGLSYFSGVNVGGDKSSSSTKNSSLILYFNKNKILQNYTFRTERF